MTLAFMEFHKRLEESWHLEPDTSSETPPARNSEKIERRTSNAHHRTSRIDDATLYLF